MDFYVELGKNIKKYRIKNKLTQEELAEKLNMSLNFVGKIEVAFSKPSLNTLIKIAQILNTTVSDLTKFKINN